MGKRKKKKVVTMVTNRF